MKILHTSDWHLGHTLYGYDRREEQRAMLSQIAEIVREERPDLLLVSGDVFDVAQPPSWAQTMLVEALMEIHRAYPEIAVVVTAGNHDSGTRHEIFRKPMHTLGIHLVGVLSREDSGAGHIVELPGKGFVVAVPYVHERNMPEGFIDELMAQVELRNAEGLPVVISAHTTVIGADFTGHTFVGERYVGGIDGVKVERFGTGYDYLALGHIHRPQFVHTGRHNVRYSGTPLAVSFDEAFPHTVSIVEIGAHGERPNVRERKIENPWPLETLPSDGAVGWDEAKKLFEDFPGERKAYIRLNVEVEDFLPSGANAEAARIAEGKECRFCLINPVRKRAAAYEEKKLTVKEFKDLDPVEVARRYINESGGVFEGELEELFRIAMQSETPR